MAVDLHCTCICNCGYYPGECTLGLTFTMRESCHLIQVEVIAETQSLRGKIRNKVTLFVVFIRFFRIIKDRIQWQTSVSGVLSQSKFGKITGVMVLSLNFVVRRFKDYKLCSDNGLWLFSCYYLSVILNMTLFKKCKVVRNFHGCCFTLVVFSVLVPYI